uniref:glutamine-rich protein 2 isoform X1 n=1 Tax=Gasterosteus aculeatus aculeatus TaxID=481459 RepID=UPI001A97F800|nr:glutamine-rich protein 2 isoform X1 [Gasterosteus aculeatus aculeatus]
MSEHTLFDLLNDAIETPQKGVVNFSALHALLHAVLRRLDARDAPWKDARDTPWKDARDTPWRAPERGGAGELKVEPGEELQQRIASPSSSSGPAAGDQLTRIRTCEDGVFKAMKLIEELREQRVHLKEEMKELCHQQKVEADPSQVQTCPLRVDALEETVRSLRDTFQKYPDPEALRGVGQLEARVTALEGGKADREQLTQLRERITTTSSPGSSEDVVDQLNQQRSLINGLMGDRQKLDDLRGALKDAVQSMTSQLAGSQSGQSSEGRKLSRLLQQQEQLQDAVSGLLQRPAGSTENAVVASEVQKVILQLQAKCENLHESISILNEDSRQKQSHLEELLRTTDQLEEKKADKQMVESGIKADKGALESKVSRRQFDSATEELSAMFHELLSKVTGQEQEWRKVVDRLSTEMECKLNRMELDSVKKQLEDGWKNYHQKLQAEGSPEQDDAAGIKRQLVARFHCLSCDRPLVMHSPSLNLSSSDGSSSHQPVRPFTIYTQEQFRHHCRSQQLSEETDCSRLSVPRSCGGSHTVTSAKELRSILQPSKQHVQVEVDQSEEVDIIGLDGHVYKGRLNTPARNPETKLPTISTKDGKTKDKAKCSQHLKRSASPELPPPLSVRSAVCSRSASSTSGRDWPVSALGCTSRSSVTPASAAAESQAEPLDL